MYSEGMDAPASVGGKGVRGYIQFGRNFRIYNIIITATESFRVLYTRKPP